MRHLIRSIAVVSCAVSAYAAAQSGVGLKDPAQIMSAVYEASWREPRSARMRLLITADGDTRERRMVVRTKGDAETRKSLVLVEAPPDLRGTGFVSVDYTSGAGSERWLYLPKLKRSSRIAGGQMSSAFLGSDLTFGDLSQRDPRLFDFTMNDAAANVDGETCWVISATPKSASVREQLGYDSLQLWISQSKLSMVRTRAGVSNTKRVKYFQGSNFQKVGDAWAPHKLSVRTVEDGKVRSETTMLTLESKVDASISDSEFTKQRLESGL